MKFVFLFGAIFCSFVATECAEIRALQVRKMQIEERSFMDTITQVSKVMGDLRRTDLPSVCVDSLTIVRGLNLHWFIKLLINIAYGSCKVVRPLYWFVFGSTKPPSVKGFGFNTIMS